MQEIERVTDIQDIENGHSAIVEAVKTAGLTAKLSPADLRRLARLHARSEGATQVAQAAVSTAQAAQQAITQAVQEACEDHGVRVPANSSADIDWTTGIVTITPPDDQPQPQPFVPLSLPS